MKILRISLRNIASLAGTQTVDFTRDPLRTAGLFAISGITGSGKSTLLDALCLALYERTPRLNAVRTQARFADGGDSITQKDPGNLLRRGTGEGFAEVAFVGVDNAIYTARWTVRRARNRPEGSLQNPEMTLFRGDVPPGANGAIEQGGKKTEVLPAIAAKVGLSFEQFTRAVLLAQNDFATFLKADDRERAEILQALTGTQRFGEISAAVFDRHSQEQEALREFRSRLAGNEPLSVDARVEAEAAGSTAEAGWKETNKRVQGREAHLAWYRQLAELTRSVEEATAVLLAKTEAREASTAREIEWQRTEEAGREARGLWEAEKRLRDEVASALRFQNEATKAEEAARQDTDARKQTLAAADGAVVSARTTFEKATPFLRQARDLEAKLHPLTVRLADAVREREAVEKGLRELILARDEISGRRVIAEREHERVAAQRDALKIFASLAPTAEAWLHRLDHAETCRQSLQKAAEKWEARTKEEGEMSNAEAGERSKEAGLRKAVDDAGTAWKRAEAALAAYDGEKIARRREEAEAARTALRELENHLRDRQAVEAQAAEIERELGVLKGGIEADAKTLAEFNEKQIPVLTQVAAGARRAFELAEAAVADEAIRLREKLTSGQPCPVCGATEHPHAAQPPTQEAAVLRALRADCAAKEKELGNLREKAAGLGTARTSHLVQEAEKTQRQNTLRARLQELGELRFAHPAALTILAGPTEEQSRMLAAQLAAQDVAFETAKVADKAHRDAGKLRDEYRKQRDVSEAAFTALEKRLADFARNLTGLRVAREGAENARSDAAKRLEAALEKLAPLFAEWPEARVMWDRTPGEFRQMFAENTAAFLALEKRLGEVGGSMRESEAALLPAREAVVRGEIEAAAKRTVEATAQAECETIRKERAALFAGRAADVVEAELSATLRQANEARDLRARELDTANNRLSTTVEGRRGVAERLSDGQVRQTAAIAALDAWLAGFATRIGHTFSRTELEPMLARDDGWIKAERVALEAVKDAVRTAEGALAARRQAVEAHTASRPTADEEPIVTAELAALRTALALATARRDHARAVLLADDHRRRDNAVLTGQLHAREAMADPWLKLNELIGSADGAKFRGIAQRRTLDILLGYANAQLDQLTSRYRLERLPESLNLLVVDRDMGDERRSVHSLSGGESFLVSLALALALASLTSNRLRIESLFIDEGFGSLDPETLNTAMNALMHLEAQGRKVGVISHVTEMTDAIPVQIRVVKGRSGASRVIVPGAPAVPEAIESGEEGAKLKEIAAKILSILHRESTAGVSKVSARALRLEIGCDADEFASARVTLEAQVKVDGRSLALI